MIRGITVLLLCQLVGEVLSKAFNLPVPGPVIGMLLLLAGLVIRGSVPKSVDDTAAHLLPHLSLLFIPAGVGIIQYVDALKSHALLVLTALFVSTWLIMILVGWTWQYLNRRASK